MKPQITTILPTHRRPKTLKRALQSALDQTCCDIQVRVYDNASGDETAAIVRSYARRDPRVHYHCHPQDIDAVPNFQHGLSEVDTPFFSFLSDDDALLPEFYATALSLLHKYPDAAACIGSVITENEQGQPLDYSLSKWPDQEYVPSPQGLYRMISHYSNWTGALFRTSLTSQIGPLNPELRIIDLDFMLRLTARFPIVISKKPCALFTDHPGSYSRRARLKIVWPGWPKMVSHLTEDPSIAPEVKSQAERLLQRNLQRHLSLFALRAIEARHFDEADRAVKLLKMKTMSVFLRALVGWCEAYPLCCSATTSLLRWRRNLKRLFRISVKDKKKYVR